MNDLSTAARLDAASDAEPDLCAGVAQVVATKNSVARRRIRPLTSEGDSMRQQIANLQTANGVMEMELANVEGLQAAMADAYDVARKRLQTELEERDDVICELRIEAAELHGRITRQARTIFEQADIIARRWKWLAFVGVVAWLVGAVMGSAWWAV